MKKIVLSITALSFQLMAFGTNAQSDSTNNTVLGEKDLPNIIASGQKSDDQKQKSTIEFMRKYKNNNFRMQGKVVGYYNSDEHDYSIIWVRKDDSLKVGCLANANDEVFDAFAIDDSVIIEGIIQHINYVNSPDGDLVLSRGCGLSVTE